MNLPKVAIVDDHIFYRNGVALAIKRFSFVEFAFEASNGEEFIDKQQKKPADIVLLDVMMPGMNGYETLKTIKKDYPAIKTVILTMLDSDDTISHFIDAGVNGYLLKNIDNKGLATALKAVINGQVYYSQELMSYFTRKLGENNKKQKSQISLTSRELEILELIYNGFSNKEIADKLFVSVRTITNHRYNLKIKTESKNTAGLISFGLKNNLFK
ncbi:MAG TPA: response regulator transcription factor [Bacteroidales bacterium]|nr:response regulator transcription factor [Bacteroidales bacterium]